MTIIPIIRTAAYVTVVWRGGYEMGKRGESFWKYIAFWFLTSLIFVL